jgi:hypothetical protein
MKDVEIKVNITKTTTPMTEENDDKRYTNFIRKSIKLYKMKDSLTKLETKMEDLMTKIAITENELLDVLDNP